MKKEYLYGILGLLGGAIIALIFTTSAVNSNNTSMMKMMGMHAAIDNDDKPIATSNSSHMMSNGSMMHNMDDGMSMDEMTQALKGKTGDEFDKAFIDEMIVHHQGAIDMANLALKNAKHQEIKDLSDAIIKAQTTEIEEMKSWRSSWDY
jgi:uncharacterized protein (DUF305 family)